MKFGDLKLGVEYGVIPSWDYSNAEKKDPERVRRRDLAKAELVSLEKYEYKVFRFDSPDNPNFQPAPKGSRSVGYMVKSDQFNNETVYWLARPQDIIADYASLEHRWNEQERIQKEEEERKRQEHLERERKEKEIRDREQRTLDSVLESLRFILGSRADQVKYDISNRRTADGSYLPKGEVTFDLRTLGVLVEKVLEAKDLVG